MRTVKVTNRKSRTMMGIARAASHHLETEGGLNMKYLMMVLLLVLATPVANAACGGEVLDAYYAGKDKELLENAIKDAVKEPKGPFNYSETQCEEMISVGKSHYWTYRDCLPHKIQKEQDEAWGKIGFTSFCNHKAVVQEIAMGKARFISYMQLLRQVYSGENNVPFGQEERVTCEAFRKVWNY